MKPADIEMSFIGGLLSRPAELVKIVDKIKPADFSEENAIAAYSAMVELWRAKEDIAIDTVAHKIGYRKTGWLAECLDVGLYSTLTHNAKLIREYGKKRRLANKLTQVQKDLVFSESKEILKDLFEVCRTETESSHKKIDIKSIVSRFRKVQAKNRERGSFGIPTGFDFLEKCYIQYVPGHLWMVGAYTSTGKTAFMVNAIVRVICQGPSILVLSTEMTESQLFARLVACTTGFGANVILAGALHDTCLPAEQAAVGKYTAQSIEIDDSVKTVEQIENRAKQAQLQGGVDIVFVDFIQNVRKYGCRSKYEESSQIAIDLQNLAKETQCTIVCLSQITASVHKENSDTVEYKGAGELAEACDIGLWLRRNKEDAQQVLVSVRKNRHGPLGKQVFRYNDNYTKMQEFSSVEND